MSCCGCFEFVNPGGVYVIDIYNLTLCALVTVAMQTVFFVAAICKFDKVIYIAGASNFVVLALLTFLLPQTFGTRQIVVFVVVFVWAIRLSAYLLYRSTKMGEDKCFVSIRKNILKFAAFCFFQAVSVFSINLSVVFIHAAKNAKWTYSGPLDIIGTILAVLGLLLEVVADVQKFRFRNEAGNNGKWCAVGLWYWSRHPNYLGEIVMWLGIFLMSCSVVTYCEWVVVISPIYVVCRLLFVTGMPVLEQKSEDRYGGRADYQEYKKQTSPLLLLPPRLYRSLWDAVKCLLLCELPFYTVQPKDETKPISNAPPPAPNVERT